jgi:hypothetical protein
LTFFSEFSIHFPPFINIYLSHSDGYWACTYNSLSVTLSANNTPIVVSHISHFPITETPVKSKLGDFPVEYSYFSPEMKEESLENFDVLAYPEVVNWFRLESLNIFLS